MPNNEIAKTKSALSRQWWVAIALLLLSIAVVTVYGQLRQPDFVSATIAGKSYRLEVARTEQERNRGLSNRDTLPANNGMLFVFDADGVFCFWMKDTRIPLDMIWLSAEHKIIHITPDVKPETYPETFCPPKPARFVVELPSGDAHRLGLQLGQALSF